MQLLLLQPVWREPQLASPERVCSLCIVREQEEHGQKREQEIAFFVNFHFITPEITVQKWNVHLLPTDTIRPALFTHHKYLHISH